jgi:two-component system, chemotaxis family, chemotaxis protein CheV
MEDKKGILLESGTNELEIVEYQIGDNRFGINVIKVKEILNVIPVTKIPHGHHYIEGIIQLRGEVLPVVDLAKAVGFPPSNSPQTDKYIVCEFNKLKIIFHVHGVSQIHRISWDKIEKPNDMFQGLEAQVIGVIKRDEDMVLLIDYERIVTEINPKSGIQKDDVKKLGVRERQFKKLLIAEDSALLRSLLHETLSEAGYSDIEFFEDGASAYDYLEHEAEAGDISSSVQLVITDIEMPKMDGHYLTRKIKENSKLSMLPVIIFSSLITEDLRHKGDVVGADSQISKPEVVELVQVIDKLVL